MPPLSSPRCGPPQRTGRAIGHHGLRHTPLRRGIPRAGHALRRLPARAYPQRSCKNDSHRPTIHRPQHRRRGQRPHRTSGAQYQGAGAPNPLQAGSPAPTVRTVDNAGPMESFAAGAAPAYQDTDCCPAARIPRHKASGPSQRRGPTAGRSNA